jgi:hypothetical protein
MAEAHGRIKPFTSCLGSWRKRWGTDWVVIIPFEHVFQWPQLLWKQPRCSSTDEWNKKMWYLYTMQFYSVTKENEFFFIFRYMDGTGEHHLKWSQPGSEKQKPHVLSHMWNIGLIQRQQCYETLVTLRGSHIQERQSKRRKLRSWIGLIYYLYKNEHIAETITGKGLR